MVSFIRNKIGTGLQHKLTRIKIHYEGKQKLNAWYCT